MAIQAWWEGEPSERYWMEVTDRTDLGADLHIPQVDGGGREYWSYSLVAEVEEGDIVLHWWKRSNSNPALVGWSRAVGTVQAGTIDWLAHGTRGRERGESVEQPSWWIALEGFTELARPVTLADMRRLEPRLLRERNELAAAFDGPLYFPFAFSDKRPLRTTQGYLMKFPAALLAVVPGLPTAATAGRGRNTPERSGPSATRGEDQRQSDPALRRAVERHSVGRVIGFLVGEGYECADVGTIRPYDIEAVRGDEVLHVEVKGSISRCLTVELTEGEVDHADGGVDTLLAVVDGIDWKYEDGEVVTAGGDLRLWWSWVPDEDSLVPIRYRYLLPPD